MRDKGDAIRQTGELLVMGGHVRPDYVAAMLAREATMSTYLGNGVAIPHGQDASRAHIESAGIAVLQIPAGVEWEPGERVFLVIGIAAGSDEHVSVLSNLADLIEDPEMTEQLTRATDPVRVVELLNRARTDAPGGGIDPRAGTAR